MFWNVLYSHASQCCRCDFAGILKAVVMIFAHWFPITVGVLSH